jgi:hypothetical protein
MLAYLSRYTHRIAISNRRLVAWDDTGVTFKWNDYRLEGPDRYKTMTLAVGEFISRFLMHVLPKRFHRIRHCGLFANGARAENIVAGARAAEDGGSGQSASVHQYRRSGALASLPVLRRAHVHHRDVRARNHTSHSAVDTDPCDRVR